MRTIIIGDVHGCNRALLRLLDRIKPEAGMDRLVFLGDLFDRGPDSAHVFQTVQRLADAFGRELIVLRGNHEDYLLQPKLTLRQRLVWEKVGRAATVRSFQKTGKRMEDSIPWIREHVCLFWKDDGYQCVHAGVLVEPIEANDLQTLIHTHETVFENKYSGTLTITGHVALKKAAWFSGDGETVTELEEEEKTPLPATGIICIDTGCGKGGRLTAMIIDHKEFVLISEAENGPD